MAYVGKIQDSSGVTGLIGSTLYGTSSTGASTVAKVVVCSDFDKLMTGVTIHVKFTNSNTATNPTLNVNSTGAKSIYKYGTTVPGTAADTSWPAGSVVSFTYDGSAWIMNDHIDNTNTDTKVTQAYSTTNNTYPVLLSSVAGISSTTSRGDQTSIVNNKIYANPSTGRLYANIPEAFLFWGGKDFAGSYGPIDAAMIPTLSANRAAFYPGDRIVVEYTRDGGTTWLDYGADNTTKTALFTTSASFVVGKSTTSEIATPSCKLRITIKNTYGKLYSYIQKIAIYVSTGGSTGCTVDIKGRTRTNVEAESDTWANLKTAVPISGYSGWNILQTSFTTYGNTPSKSLQYDEIRFIFSITDHTSTAAGLSVSKIYMYGGVGWQTPSTLASTGLIYTYDASQNVVFPAKVTSTSMATSSGDITCGGTFVAKANIYTDELSSGALNMRNSDIYGCNSIKFADLCDNGAEGIQFYRDGTHADSFYGKSGKLYYHPNRAYGSTAGDVYTILHTGNLTITQSLTSGTKIGTITIDGTGTDLYAPSDTDTKVTQTAVGSAYTNYRPLVISAANDATAGFSPSTVTDSTFITAGIYCQPSSGSIFATTLNGDLKGTINTATTATTQTKGDSSTKVATTAFVQTAISDYIPLTGADNISGNLKFNTKSRGIYLMDKNDVSYGGIVDNGSNLWIGSTGQAATHHSGYTYISTGHNGTTGNPSIKVAIPNDENTNSALYDVLHKGNTFVITPNTLANDWTDVGVSLNSEYCFNLVRLGIGQDAVDPPAWAGGTGYKYGSGLSFGTRDSAGLITLRTANGNTTPDITFAGGGRNDSGDSTPDWYMALTGTSGTKYNLDNFSTTDTHVNVTKATQTKAYLLGTSTTPGDTATAVESVSDSGVFLTTTAGELQATTFKGDLKGTINTATTATTQTKGNSSTKVATTAFVQTAIGDYIPLAGSDAISGDLKFNANQKGVYLKDAVGTVFAGIYHNGTNFWIGSHQSAATHFTGATFISAGYDSSSSKGNLTIKVYTPNAANTSATGRDVFHNANLVAGTGLSIATAAHSDYNGTKYTINHTDSVTAVTTAELKKLTYNASGHITGKANIASTDVDSLLTLCPTGTAIPDDDTYYISQSTNGTNEYNRRSVKYLWQYMFDKVVATYYNNNSGFADAPWAKVASATITSGSAHRHIEFLVGQAFRDGTTTTSYFWGILAIRFNTSSSKVYGSGQVEWLVAHENLDKDNIVVTYTNVASTSTTIEIWAKTTVRYCGYTFRSLTGLGLGLNSTIPTDWTFYDPTSGVATYTGTLIASSYSNLKNNAAGVNITETTTDSTYYIPFVADKSGYKPILANGDITFESSEGDTTSIGASLLGLGNSTAEGSNGNAYGALKLYGLGSKYIALTAKSVADSNKEIKLPNYSGTVMVTGVGDTLTSSNDLDTDTKDIAKHWNALYTDLPSNSPVSGYGYHVFNIPTTSTANKYQKQLLFGNTSIIPYMYRYLSNGTWSGGWRSPGTGFMYVIGTQSSGTEAWTGVIPIPALYDGLTIAYFLPRDSTTNSVTLELTLSNGTTTGAIPVYTVATRMTNQINAGAVITLTYFSAGSISVSGSATTTDRWIANDAADVAQVLTTGNVNYPLLMSWNSNTNTTSAVRHRARRANNMYANPSTGKITATSLETKGSSYATAISNGSSNTANRSVTMPDVDGEVQVSTGQQLIYHGRIVSANTELVVTVTNLYRLYRLILVEVYGGTGYSWHATWPLTVIKNINTSSQFGFHVLDTETASDIDNKFIVVPSVSQNKFTIQSVSGTFPAGTEIRVYSLI